MAEALPVCAHCFEGHPKILCPNRPRDRRIAIPCLYCLKRTHKTRACVRAPAAIREKVRRCRRCLTNHDGTYCPYGKRNETELAIGHA